MEFIKVTDRSELIRDALDNLVSRALYSVVIVFLILRVFFSQTRLPLIILSTILFSVFLTIIFYFFAGMTLNVLTLAGLAIGLGMMVDNSVVVLDNIYRHFEVGESAQHASIRGALQVTNSRFPPGMTSQVPASISGFA